MNTAVRDKILQVYLAKCTHEYSVKFHRWRIKHFGQDNGVDKDGMDARKRVLEEKEALLFKGTEIVEEDSTATASKQA